MRLEDRGIRRQEFRRLTRTRLTSRRVALRGFTGVAGVLDILETSGKWVVSSVGGQVTIAAPGYRWLQLAPDNGEWWLTAMYDPHGGMVQYYFDIVYNIYTSHDGELRFRDLFLDIVMADDGTLKLLDRDELERARSDGIVDDATYNRALSTAERLLGMLEGNEPAWRGFCGEILDLLETAGADREEGTVFES